MRPFVTRGALLSATVLLGIGAAVAPKLSRISAQPELARPSGPSSSSRFQAPGEAPVHSFYFSRAMYSGGGWGRRRGGSWATDYPKADIQFLTVLRRLTNVDAYPEDNAVRLDDPNLRRFPFLYAVEVGHMSLTDAEVQGLRDFLLAGGFMMTDDFWGTYEWRQFEEQMRRVFPEHPIVEIPRDHPIFNAFYEIPEIIQVPVVNQGVAGGPTHEQDGFVAHCRGIFDDKGRLMVVINWNTDLGDAWEWAEVPRYPLKYSTYAYQLGANFIAYAMSH